MNAHFFLHARRLHLATLMYPLFLLQPVMAAPQADITYSDGASHALAPATQENHYTGLTVTNNSELVLGAGNYVINNITLGAENTSAGRLLLNNGAAAEVTRVLSFNSAVNQASALTINGGSSLRVGLLNEPARAATDRLDITVSGQNSRLVSGMLVASGRGAATITITDSGLIDLQGNRDQEATRVASGGGLRINNSASGLTVTGAGQFVGDDIEASEGARIEARGAGSLIDLNSALTLTDSTFNLAEGARLMVNNSEGAAPNGINLRNNSTLVAGGANTIIDTGRAQVGSDPSVGGHIEFLGNNATLYLGTDSSLTPAAAPVAAATLRLAQGSRGIVFAAAQENPANTQKLVFNHNASDATPYVFSANVEGAGTLEHAAGATVMTGTMADFTGTMRITGGSMTLTESAPQSGVTVARGGRLVAQSETPLMLHTVALTDGASMHIPSGSVSLTTLTLASGSNLQLGITTDTAAEPRLMVFGGGGAELGGATLTLENGSNLEVARAYSLIQADQISGRFADHVTVQNLQGNAEPFAFLTPTVDYTTTAVSVSFTRRQLDAGNGNPVPNPAPNPAPNPPPVNPQPVNPPPANPQPVNPQPVQPVPPAPPPVVDNQAKPENPPPTADKNEQGSRPIQFQDRAATSTQSAVAKALDSLPANNPLHAFVLGLPASAPARTFEALSGDALSAVDNSLSGSSVQSVSAVPMARLQQQLAAARRPGQALAAAGSSLPASAMPYAPPSSLWVQTMGNWQRERSTADEPGLRGHTGGVFLGADHKFSSTGWIAGAALGATRSKITVAERNASSNIDNYSLTLYGGKTFALSTGDLNTQIGVSYTQHHVNSERNLAYIGLPQKLEAAYRAKTVQLFGEIGHLFALTDRSSLEPYVGVVVSKLHTPSFKESGGSAALSRAAQSDTTVTTTIGLRATTAVKLGSVEAQLHGGLGYRHAMGELTTRSRYAFNGGESFSIARRPSGKNSMAVSAGIDAQATRATRIGVSYSGDFANRGSRQHSAIAELRWRF